MRNQCFCFKSINWFCSEENSFLMICSLSSIAASFTPSSNNLRLSFSVDTARLSTGAINSLLDILGNMSFIVCNTSTHANLSSLLSALRWSLFVPVKIENLLSSDRLSRIDETWTELLNYKRPNTHFYKIIANINLHMSSKTNTKTVSNKSSLMIKHATVFNGKTISIENNKSSQLKKN